MLIAQLLGLNTCWVALTYSKVKSAYTGNEGEKLVLVIAIGYGKTQGRRVKAKRRTRSARPMSLHPNGL